MMTLAIILAVVQAVVMVVLISTIIGNANPENNFMFCLALSFNAITFMNLMYGTMK